jgi:hypothetical protein
MTHLVGEQRAIPIEYESDLVTLGDIYGLLEELTGGIDGWRTLVKFSGRAWASGTASSISGPSTPTGMVSLSGFVETTDGDSGRIYVTSSCSTAYDVSYTHF